MRIDPSGNVGIGTTPSGLLTSGYVLRLNGGAQTYLAFNNNTYGTQVTGGFVIGNDNATARITQRENAPLLFSTNNTERLRIDSAGNVGIGTTPSGNAKLQVTSQTTSEEGIKITTLGTGNDFYALKIGTGTSADTFSVTNAGNVGIGTSSPSSAGSGYTGLDIRGSGGGSIRYGVSSGFNMLTYATDFSTDFVPSVASDIRFFNKTGVTESIRFQSGGGISFNGDTAAANALDDYEEGTFTPVVSDASSGGNTATGTFSGSYTKVGNIVHVDVTLGNINTSGMTSGNQLYMQGLPFTKLNNGVSSRGALVGDNITYSGTLVASVNAGQSFAYFLQSISGTNDSSINVSAITASGASDIFFSLTYTAS